MNHKSICLVFFISLLTIPLVQALTISPLSTGVYNSTDTNITQEFNFAHLNVSTSTPYDSLIRYYTFDNDNATKSYDFSSSNINGNYTNGANTKSGMFGDAYNGSSALNSFLNLNSNLIPGDNNFTISLWFRANSLASFGMIIGSQDNGNSNYLTTQDNNKVNYRSGAGDFTSTATLSTNTWYHLVVRNNNTGATIFINGAVNANSATPRDWNQEKFNLGTRNSGDLSFSGLIDDFMVFNISLNNSQVSDIYNNQSSRFFPTGEQLFQNINFNTNTKVNISLTINQTLLSSYLSAKINNGPVTNFTNGRIIGYNLSGDVSNGNLSIFYTTSPNNFYSPLVGGNITIESDPASAPDIQFVSPTNPSGTIIGANHILINVTSSDTNLVNITIRLFNASNSLINSTTTTISPNFVNISNLANGVYFFNATTYNLFGISNSTETRNVTIDSTLPNGTIIFPSNGSLLNYAEVNFTLNATDNLGLANATLNIYNSTGGLFNSTTITFAFGTLQSLVGIVVNLVDDVYNWFYTVVDNAGNSFITQNNTLTINITSTNVTACGVLSSANTVYTQIANIIPVSTTPCINITAQNVTFNGNGYSIVNDTYSSLWGIWSNQLNTTIINVNVSTHAGISYGIRFQSGAHNSTIRDSTLISGFADIRITSADNIKIINNTLPGGGNGTGIYLETSNYNFVANNTVINHVGGVGAADGITTAPGSHNIIIGNNASGNFRYGFSSFANSINNTITNNYFDANHDSGIFLSNSYNSTFINNTANNNYHNGIYLSGTETGHVFINITINNSGWNGIYIDFGTATSNNFTNIRITNTNSSFFDLNITELTSRDNYFIDTYIGNYTILNATLNIKNSQFGEIKFINPINGTGTNLSNDIKILSNLAVVNSSNTGLNSSANITLYNTPTNFTFPVIYKNGFNCLDCSNFTSLNAGNVSFNVTSWSNYSIGEDLIPPAIQFVSPTETSGTNLTTRNYIKINVTAIDSNLKNITVYLFNSTALINSTNSTTSPLDINFSNLANGLYYFNATAFDTSGNVNNTETRNVTISIDNIFPQFFNLSATPTSPVNYSSGVTYTFNATWTDNVAVDTIKIEFNGVNYTVPVSGTPNVYSFTRIDLSAGTYPYYWFANDSSGNVNVTSIFNYIINKTVPPITLSFSPSSTVNQGTETTTSGLSCPSQLTCNLFQGTIAVSNPHITTFGVGTYPYTFNTTGNTNYTSASVTTNLTVQATGGGGNVTTISAPVICPENKFGFYNPLLPHIVKAGCL